MKVEDFVEIIGAEYFVGVPDSQLKALCNYLIDTYGIDHKHHVIAANEGNAAALAAGYYLASGKVPLVYMQNSGEGNIINPVASLLSPDVYAIPTVFVIGWRGEPGVHDEPQHVQQGKVTIDLLDVLGIDSFILGKDTTKDELNDAMVVFREQLDQGKCVAFVVSKGALEFDGGVEYANDFPMKREEILEIIVDRSEGDPIISTTGKTSRELFEIREARGQAHKYDFLTVGSMGHASSIALGVASQLPGQRVWCIEGDGALLMHMGAMPVIGSCAPHNLIHIVINNNAHESVGGQPTVMSDCDLPALARACGYVQVKSASNLGEFEEAMDDVLSKEGPVFIEVKSAIGSRSDLGRPTTTPQENKKSFMEYLKELR